MPTRLLLICWCLLAVEMTWQKTAAADLPASRPGRPNILFVFADQWRASATGYAGDPNVHTPNLDQLEAASVNFTHAVSGCPVCTPFRGSLMTGQRPATNGMFLNDAHLPDDTRKKDLAGVPEAADVQAKLNALLNKRLKAAGDEFLPGEKYVEKWKYAVDATGTLPTGP